jgi:hypothetical protein
VVTLLHELFHVCVSSFMCVCVSRGSASTVWRHAPFGFCFCVLIALPCVTIRTTSSTSRHFWEDEIKNQLVYYQVIQMPLCILGMCDARVCLRMYVCECVRAFVPASLFDCLSLCVECHVYA